MEKKNNDQQTTRLSLLLKPHTEYRCMRAPRPAIFFNEYLKSRIVSPFADAAHACAQLRRQHKALYSHVMVEDMGADTIGAFVIACSMAANPI